MRRSSMPMTMSCSFCSLLIRESAQGVTADSLLKDCAQMCCRFMSLLSVSTLFVPCLSTWPRRPSLHGHVEILLFITRYATPPGCYLIQSGQTTYDKTGRRLWMGLHLGLFERVVVVLVRAGPARDAVVAGGTGAALVVVVVGIRMIRPSC